MMKNKRNGIVILVLFLLTIEIYLIIDLIYKYKGVQQVYILAPIVAVLLYGCFRMLYQNKRENKVGIISVFVITIVICGMTILTRPTYSYKEGRVLVEKYLESSDDSFNEVKNDKMLIPLTNEKQHVLIGQYGYYYKYIDDINELFFIVNPLTGKVSLLEDEFN